MSNETVCKVAKKVFKKTLTKIIPIPGVNIAFDLVDALLDGIDKHLQEKLAFVRKKEKQYGSKTAQQIALVGAAFEGCADFSSNNTADAVLLVSSKKVFAWYAPNRIWVFHLDPTYRPSYRLANTKIYRPKGNQKKDGTWDVKEEPA